MGLVVRAPIDIRPNSKPCRMPSFWMGEIWAISTGPKEMKAPEENPKSAANVMIAALLDAGIHRARTRIEVRNATRIKMLNLPNLSERTPGMIRPNKLENEGRKHTYRFFESTGNFERSSAGERLALPRSIWELDNWPSSSTFLQQWPVE